MDRIVEFRLGSADLSAVRFGVSPGFELKGAIRTLLRPQDAPLHWGWIRAQRDRPRGEAFRLLATIIGVTGYMPDFLTAAPSGDMTPEEEADRLSRVSRDRLQVDLGKMVDRSTGKRRDELIALRDRPDRTRRAISAAWSEVWADLLEPVWTQLLRLLRSDIAVRSRRSSDAGLADMASGLHSTVSWGEDTVRVKLRSHSEVVDCAGAGLVLVPSVLTETRGCAVLTERPAQPTIFYPAHGVSETWYRDGTDTRAALGALLGPARGGLLLDLQQPLSTSECAAMAGLAVSTASHHLTVLREAGLIDSRRAGPRVEHSRTPLGEALAQGR